MLKHDLKVKFKVGIHLDLFYTKKISLMQYFLFAVLITKLYQVKDDIIYTKIYKFMLRILRSS